MMSNKENRSKNNITLLKNIGKQASIKDFDDEINQETPFL